MVSSRVEDTSDEFESSMVVLSSVVANSISVSDSIDEEGSILLLSSDVKCTSMVLDAIVRLLSVMDENSLSELGSVADDSMFVFSLMDEDSISVVRLAVRSVEGVISLGAEDKIRKLEYSMLVPSAMLTESILVFDSIYEG